MKEVLNKVKRKRPRYVKRAEEPMNLRLREAERKRERGRERKKGGGSNGQSLDKFSNKINNESTGL